MYREECLQLGLPEPRRGESQISYLTRLMMSGHRVNTRIARVIGIGNLHSIAPELTKKKIPFSLEHKKASCPKTGNVPPQPVDHIWMTESQREEYLKKKKGSKR